MSNSTVLNAANSMVGAHTKGVLTASGGVPVLATPGALVTVGVFAAATATPATGALFGGAYADGDSPLPEGLQETGATVDELAEAVEVALIG